jgi:hypothetical protein
MPRASTIDGKILFFDANDSRRAKRMQFTTISGIKMPRAAVMFGGAYASIKS